MGSKSIAHVILNYVAGYSPLHVHQKEQQPVVIGSFGYENDFGKDFLKKLDHDQWSAIDVRQWLRRDPSATIKHNENGGVARTQKAVLGQEGYFECFSYIMNAILDGHHAIGLGCKAGQHRSDTMMRHVKDACNMATDIVHQC